MIAGSDLAAQEQKLLTFAPLTDKIVFMSFALPKYITDLSPGERKKFFEDFGKAVAAHQHNSNPIIPTKEDSHTVEILYPCHSCSKPIYTTDDYCSIHHYKMKASSESRHLHFHERCFEQIAGKEYM